MWIDSHAHLADYSDEQIGQTIEQAIAEGVGCIINTATGVSSARNVVLQSSRFLQLYAAVGISPFDVEGLDETWASTIQELSSCNKVVGIGEIGLDATNERYPAIQRQLPVFTKQLEIARDRNLTAIIHSRGAEKDVLDICVQHGLATAVFHCYTGALDVLRKIIDNGYYVSFSGIITFSKNPLVQLVQYAPLDRILIETDTPYLAPVPHRGKPNQPSWVHLVGEAVAAIKGLPVHEVAAQLTRNVRNVFKIDC